jgi:hypothetical protein
MIAQSTTVISASDGPEAGESGYNQRLRAQQEARARGGSMACTTSSYKGRYAFRATGFITAAGSPPEPFAVVGHFKADGKGKIVGSQTRNFKGKIVHETFSETYTVNPDCTGSSKKTTSAGIKTNWDFVISGQGNTILAIETDANNVVTIRARRM